MKDQQRILALTPDEQLERVQLFLTDRTINFLNTEIVKIINKSIPVKILLQKTGDILYIYPEEIERLLNQLITQRSEYIQSHFPEFSEGNQA